MDYIFALEKALGKKAKKKKTSEAEHIRKILEA